MDNQLKQISKFDGLTVGYGVYLRVLSLICLAAGCMFWLRLVGVFPGEFWRIDRMPWQWQTLSATLSVLYPVAAIGLWMRSPWGIILWTMAALTESLAFTVYSSEFTSLPLIALLHSVLFLIFIALQVAILLKKRRKDEVVTEY